MTQWKVVQVSGVANRPCLFDVRSLGASCQIVQLHVLQIFEQVLKLQAQHTFVNVWIYFFLENCIKMYWHNVLIILISSSMSYLYVTENTNDKAVTIYKSIIFGTIYFFNIWTAFNLPIQSICLPMSRSMTVKNESKLFLFLKLPFIRSF